MASDLATFTLAFAIVWGGLAVYLVRLHLLARRLEARLAQAGVNGIKPKGGP